MSLVFDTLKLSKSHGRAFTPEQAEVLTEALAVNINESLATKVDLAVMGAELKAEIATLQAKLAAKIAALYEAHQQDCVSRDSTRQRQSRADPLDRDVVCWKRHHDGHDRNCNRELVGPK